MDKFKEFIFKNGAWIIGLIIGFIIAFSTIQTQVKSNTDNIQKLQDIKIEVQFKEIQTDLKFIMQSLDEIKEEIK